MRREHLRSGWLAMLFCAGLLMAGGNPGAALADGPTLAIWLAGAETEFHPFDEIQRIGFERDTLVVIGPAGSDRYAAESILRIEFLSDLSRVDDPRSDTDFSLTMHLFQNRPNPFWPQTGIEFELGRAGPVELSVYSVDGRLIRTLVSDRREIGRHTVIWDGRTDAGARAPGGIYFYQLIAPGIEESQRMILLP